MTAADPPPRGDLVAHGVVDGAGRLVSAEPALDALNRRAGGDIGRPLAVPALAAAVRLAHRLRITVSRSAAVADTVSDLCLWIRAEPVDDGVRFAVTGWHEPPPDVMSRSTGGDLAVVHADWRWQCDAALRLIRLPAEAGQRLGFDPAALLGEPLTRLFDPGAAAAEAIAERRPFADCAASLRATGGGQVILSALVRRDAGGGFGGYAGSVGEIPVTPLAAPAPIAGFAAGLDKALRRPLAQIVANADSIHAATDGPIGPDYAGYAADIAQAGRHLLGMIDDLVDLQAVELADFAPAADRIDLADVAGRAAGLLSVRAAQAGVAIERPRADARCWATGDFRRTLQILVNLIGNAVRYAPRGSIVLLGLTEGDGRVELSVADEGKGIAAVDQTRVFEKFERVDTSEPGGSGLGLYISRRLALAMGGDLTLASVPGEGATFTLSLPTAEGGPA